MRGLAGTAGFALEDLRRLTDEIGPGERGGRARRAPVGLHLREAVLDAGGRLLGQGFLTPEVVMVVGAEIQARADAEAALELAQATRGAALVEALGTVAAREEVSIAERTRRRRRGRARARRQGIPA